MGASAEEGEHDKSHLFSFTGVACNKAGIAADKKMVAEFVYQMSKESAYTQHQQDLDAKQQVRTEAMVAKLAWRGARLSPFERLAEARYANSVLDALETRRQLSRTYCVVDMDMFYAAVEIRDRPELAHKPVAVGGISMLCTANYVARLYGVRAAMPGFIAQEMVRNPQLVGSKMPPDELIIIPPNFTKYTLVAETTRGIMREYDQHFSSHSLDEAFLDLTSYLKAHVGLQTEDVVQELRNRVKMSTGLTCSAGIGPNPMLAKIVSDDNKPNGQSIILPTRENVLAYIENLPVRRVPGCGKVLERQLRLLFGVTTCGELRRAATGILRAFDGKKTRDYLLRISLGLSSDEVGDEGGSETGNVNRKSLSSERTFKDMSSPDELRRKLLSLCRSVAEEMASSVPPLEGKTLSLKVKAANFEVRNKQVHCSQGFFGFRSKFSRANQLGPTWPSTECAIDSLPNSVGVHSTSSSCGVEAAWCRGSASGGDGMSTCKHIIKCGSVAGECAQATCSDKDYDAVEGEVARLARQMYCALLPCLEEQFPCCLRLMGVRISNFRGACVTLRKGQQQLPSLFRGSGNQASVIEVVDVSESSDGDRETNTGDQARVASVPMLSCIDVADPSEDEVGWVGVAVGGPLAPSGVNCPVCGAHVSFSDANSHVNGHYDSLVLASSLSIGSGKKRRTDGGGLDRLGWSVKRSCPGASVAQ